MLIILEFQFRKLWCCSVLTNLTSIVLSVHTRLALDELHSKWNGSITVWWNSFENKHKQKERDRSLKRPFCDSEFIMKLLATFLAFVFAGTIMFFCEKEAIKLIRRVRRGTRRSWRPCGEVAASERRRRRQLQIWAFVRVSLSVRNMLDVWARESKMPAQPRLHYNGLQCQGYWCKI